MTIFLISGFCLQSLAQYRTKRFCHNSKTDITTNRTKRYLLTGNYPWYVCLEGSNLTHTEKEWTRRAMLEWNTAYYDYKMSRWGSADVLFIPQGPLFKESCDYYHGIIYIKKSHLPGERLGQHTHKGGWFRPFQSRIKMDIRDWTRELFINVMIHELGHALGMPHAFPGESELMTSHGFDCETRGETNLCTLLPADFESFLKPHNTEDAISRADWDAEIDAAVERHKEYEKNKHKQHCMGGPYAGGKCL